MLKSSTTKEETLCGTQKVLVLKNVWTYSRTMAALRTRRYHDEGEALTSKVAKVMFLKNCLQVWSSDLS